MGQNQAHVLGRNQSFFAIREPTYGTWTQVVGSGGMKVLKSTFTKKIDRRNRMDARASASLMERMTGRTECTWSMECYVIPNGTAGTAPAIHPLLLSTFGSYANVASTSDTYTPNDTQTSSSTSGTGSCTIARSANSIVRQDLTGAYVNTLKASFKGGEETKFTFEGGAKDMVHTGTSTLNGGASSGATFVVQTADVYNFQVNSIVSVGTSDNSGAGHRVTGVNTGTSTITVTPNITSQLTAADVLALVPTDTSVGSPISLTLGQFSLDSVTSYPIVEAEIEYSNNIKAFNDEAFTSSTSDYVRGFRSVKGNIKVRARRDQLIHLGRYLGLTSTTRAIILTSGSTAGNRMVVSMPYCEIDDAQLEIPESEEGTISLPFVAKGSSGADEISLAFT